MKNVYFVILVLFISACASKETSVSLEFKGHEDSIEILFTREAKTEFIKKISIGRPSFDLIELTHDELESIAKSNEGVNVIIGYKLTHTETDYGQSPLNQKERIFYVASKEQYDGYTIYEYLSSDDAHMILKVL